MFTCILIYMYSSQPNIIFLNGENLKFVTVYYRYIKAYENAFCKFQYTDLKFFSQNNLLGITHKLWSLWIPKGILLYYILPISHFSTHQNLWVCVKNVVSWFLAQTW